VRYPSGVEVNLGNELTPKSVKNEPVVDWPVVEGAYYTLVMTDPDVPSRVSPTADAQVKHWLIVNIPENQVSSGESLAVYRGSGPPLGSGLHRYVFLVYKQLKPIVHSETILPTPGREGRTGFKVRDFAQKYKLGEPIAANFFVAQYDDYVGLRNARAKSGAKPTVAPTTRAAPIETTPTTTTPPPEPVIEQQMEIEEEVMTDSPPPTERPTRTRTRSPMKGNRRSQLRDWTWTGSDWARKVAKKPKFPQMICMNYDTYKSIQSVLGLPKN
ncbi:unnamed protein product, partial [Medioppia subpectinata]